MSSPLVLAAVLSLAGSGAASWCKATLPRNQASRISALEFGAEPGVVRPGGASSSGASAAAVVGAAGTVVVPRVDAPRRLDRLSRLAPGWRATLAQTRSAMPIIADLASGFGSGS